MLEKETEVAIIGGGISGCATAYNLAKRGIKVVILDKGEVAFEASGRNMGVVRQQGRHPGEIPLMMECIRIWEHLDQELNAETDFIQGGNMLLAETEEDLKEFEESVKITQSLGLNSNILSPQEVRKVVPDLVGNFLAAMYSPKDGHADPEKATRAFARAAQEYGAKLYTNCAVLNIDLKGGRVSGLDTDLGRIEAPAVLCAAGVWTPKLLGKLGIFMPTRVVSNSGGLTEPVPPKFRPWIMANSAGFRQTAGGGIYFGTGYRYPLDYDIGLDSLKDLSIWLSRLAENRGVIKLHLSLGHLKEDIEERLPFLSRGKRPRALRSVMEPKVNHKALEDVRSAMTRLMPSLKGLRVVKTWAGFWDLTPDMIPVLGEVKQPKGLFVAAGFSGHGFALGPITGRILSELIVDGRSSLPIDAFNPSRFVKGQKVPPIKRVI